MHGLEPARLFRAFTVFKTANRSFGTHRNLADRVGLEPTAVLPGLRLASEHNAVLSPIHMALTVGFAPTIFRLRGGCSTA